jgi:hypothetical protein
MSASRIKRTGETAAATAYVLAWRQRNARWQQRIWRQTLGKAAALALRQRIGKHRVAQCSLATPAMAASMS